MKPEYIEKLPDDCKQIPNSLNWVDKKGNLYGIETRKKGNDTGRFFKYKLTPNKINGYVYAGIKYIIGNEKYKIVSKRLHIIIAKLFIENPNNLVIVGHKNNIKHDNRVENLYWTTISENTKKAFDDGLAVNAKSYEDSQSQPVVMFNVFTDEEIGRYGSCREATRETGIGLNTILNQAKYKKPVRNEFYFRFQNDKDIDPPEVVIQYEYETDLELNRFYNTSDASNKTSISEKTIAQQCLNNLKPKRKTKSGTYFLRSIKHNKINNKC